MYSNKKKLLKLKIILQKYKQLYHILKNTNCGKLNFIWIADSPTFSENPITPEHIRTEIFKNFRNKFCPKLNKSEFYYTNSVVKDNEN